MKQPTFPMLLFILLLVNVSLSGCSWLYQSHQKEEETKAVDLSKSNLEVPYFEFINQYGEPSNTDELKGKLWIANMIFVRCPSVCMMLTPNMMMLQNTFIEEDLEVHLVSFTVDPDFDTPEQLKKYGEAYQADFDYWTFVTGYTNEEIIDFSATAFQSLVMDIEGSDDMIHGTSFFLVNEEGKVIRKYDGLEPNQNFIIEDIKNYIYQ